MPATYTQQQQNHFYWRAGFGPTANMLFQPSPFQPQTYLDAFFKASDASPTEFSVSKNLVDGLTNGLMAAGRLQDREKTDAEKRREMQRQSREEIKNLNLLWLDEMVNSPAQLREKMAFFWHGHFACRNLNSFFQQQLLHEVRSHALGNFGELLRAVSKAPGMLAFLNNQQNKKQSPNENFAREVMELFTLGRGNYTETDIKEAARAFTGWGFNLGGEFVFRQAFHDSGSKTVLGKTGNFDGDDVLSILLEQRQTAHFITKKLYRFLVNEAIDEAEISRLSKVFYEAGYEIRPLLEAIFTAPSFYNKKNVGSKIKSPVELWVGIRRMMPMDIANPEIQLLLQRALGQVLLYPPNVAGWPGGKSWIDSSTLMIRMRLPQLVAMSEPFQLNAPTDDDVNMGMQGKGAAGMGNRFMLHGDVKWESLIESFKGVGNENLAKAIPAALLQSNPAKPSSVESANRENMIVQQALWAMTLPEYQLC